MSHLDSNSSGCSKSCGRESAGFTPPMPERVGVPTFHIPTMDCAAEEGEIRRALAKVPGIRRLNFQLVARTIAIDAPAESIPQALDAMSPPM